MTEHADWKYKIAACFGGSAERLFGSRAEDKDTALSLISELRKQGVSWADFSKRAELWLETELKKGKPLLSAEQKDWIKTQMEAAKKLLKGKFDA